MNFAMRLGDNADDYPLPVSGRAEWQKHNGLWCTELPLPAIPGAHIVVPSFSMLGNSHAFCFGISRADTAATTWLQQVPYRRPLLTPDENAEASFSAHIDCWHSTREVDAARVVLRVRADHEPRDYLLTITSRPLDLQVLPPSNLKVDAHTVQPLSQKMAAKPQAPRICSPTATAMALGTPWPLTVAACYDPHTRSYGCWPLAINWAAQNGRLGAVEAVYSWQDVVTGLQGGVPMVASINYRAGELSGAPQSSTGGHLVTLQAIDGMNAQVLDPAAETHDTVPRVYSLGEFGNAWLRRRGGAYIFSP